MDNVELKAYFLFLKYILYFFNSFNAFFQSAETRIHLLQLQSANFLLQICRNFLQKDYLKDVTTNINFAQKENQKDINDILLGSECEQYLEDLLLEGHMDAVTQVRQNCLQFYITAVEKVRKRLPINDDFLKKMQVFLPSISLFDSNRNTSFQHVCLIARNIGGFDEESLKYEWFILLADFTAEETQNLSLLDFDDMWKKMLQRQLSNGVYKYPNLRNLLSAVRCLPNSNADSERTFSILTDIKSKKRNKLSSTCVNAICVIKSALKSRGEIAANMKINEQHLSCMVSEKLYATCPTRKKSSFNLHAADESAGCS
ncbi:hypothetical protein DMN91_011471 [Ooceraea biroi]|uniref:HAT C-terminal dimerisation domain-containing protein n=1 Tax=Ooceraea biroi TaxID=2015173 RepID=A0A3L8D659_OOCBI|nr:hypothetical protein DMN91_011471 [Ooceraea biroi]